MPLGQNGGTGDEMQQYSNNYPFQNNGNNHGAQNHDQSDMFNPIDINEPIEGVLIPESETKISPLL